MNMTIKLLILSLFVSFVTSQQEKILRTATSREALRIEFSEKNSYKVFAKKEQADKTMANFKKAESLNIPVPKATIIPNYIDTEKKKTFAVKTPIVKGDFFQMSNSGQVTSFVNAVIKDNKKENAKKAFRTLMLAYDNGLTDPQFFYNHPLNTGIPIIFIDPHFRTGKGPDVLKSTADKIKAHFKL